MQAQTERLAKVGERLSGLESSRDSNQAQIAQLKHDLEQVRERAEQQSVQQAEELAQVRRQMDDGRSGTSEQLAALKTEQDRDRRDLDAVSDRIAVRKIPFEATKNQSRDLGEGITLHIESTNAAYRRVSGWIWFAGDHRNIWLQNRSAQEPLIFYGNQDGQKRELVITNVADNSVTGLSAAAETSGETQADAAQLGPAGNSGRPSDVPRLRADRDASPSGRICLSLNRPGSPPFGPGLLYGQVARFGNSCRLEITVHRRHSLLKRVNDVLRCG